MNPQKSQLITYSILWLREDLPKEEYLYRNFLPNIDEKSLRTARLLPWFDID